MLNQTRNLLVPVFFFLYSTIRMRLRRVGLWAAGITCAVAVCSKGVGQSGQVTNQRVSGLPHALAQIPLTSANTDAGTKPAPPSSAGRYVAEPTVIERNDREISFAADGTGSEHQTISFACRPTPPSRTSASSPSPMPAPASASILNIFASVIPTVLSLTPPSQTPLRCPLKSCVRPLSIAI